MDVPNFKLWQIDIADSAADYVQNWSILSRHEQIQAQAFSHSERQQHYVATHARLRIILAEALNENLQQLEIRRTEYGKPYLVDFPDMAFNLSHSGNKLVIAIAKNHELGIDIETCKPRKNLSALVEKCFAETEQHYWQQLPDALKVSSFYQFWTRKEAFVKATGRGIALGLNQCVLNPENHNEFLAVPTAYGAASAWRIHDIAVGDTMCGAVVLKSL